MISIYNEENFFLVFSFSSDGNYNMNYNEILLSSPSFSSCITEKQKANDDRHDLKQSKLKNMVIEELKSFFVSRNENHQQQNDDINIQLEPSISTQQTITNKSN